MDKCTQLARELLADAYAAAGFPESASDVRKGRNNYGALERASLSAIVAALSQPPEARVYQCPRCATSMEVDPTAKPEARGVVDEAMVERAREAYFNAAEVKDGVFTDPVAMRAALTTALTEARNG